MHKKITFLTLAWLSLFTHVLAQTTATMNINNVKLTVSANGALFFDGQQGQFIAPYQAGQPAISTMKSAGIWFGGKDGAGNIKGAVQMANENENADFQAGILGVDGSFNGQLTGIYRVTVNDIEAHLNDFSDNGVIDNPNPAIFGWPGRGNSDFSIYHIGESLPTTDQGLAPFFDSDQNGRYDPFKGDYPVVDIRGCEETLIYPDEMLWFAFNDQREHTQSGMNSVGMEIQCTVFGFNCEESPLGNTVFVHYKLINRASESITQTYFGAYADFDIGNPDDDFFGCDLNNWLVFGYNGDQEDEGGYGTNAPVMALDLFRGPLDEVNEYEEIAHVMPVEGDPTANPDFFYNTLKGQLLDGTPAPNNGIFYNGNPNNPSEVSEVSEGNLPGNRKVVASYGPLLLYPGARNEMIIGYTFYQQAGNTPLENLVLMFEQSNQIQGIFDNCFFVPGTMLCTPMLLNTSKRDLLPLKLFPNPVSKELTIEMPVDQLDAVNIFGMDGRLVFRKNLDRQTPSATLNLGSLPAGFYMLEGKINGLSVAREKIVVVK